MKEVAVLGAGMTLFRRHLKETGKELSFMAAKMAMDEAQIQRKDIDMVVMGTAPDAFDGIHMKGEVGHVGDDQSPGTGPHHRGGVRHHLIEGHRQGGLVPEDHVPQGISHQNEVDAGFVENTRGEHVVGSEANQATLALLGTKFWCIHPTRYVFLLGQSRHPRFPGVGSTPFLPSVPRPAP